MNIDLSGKTGVVTGSTAGIGYAIAAGLAECGATVIVNGRHQRAVDEAVARLGMAVPGAEPSSIIQRAATPEEVANLVVYIASPQASATTGAALRVDGGVVNTIA